MHNTGGDNMYISLSMKDYYDACDFLFDLIRKNSTLFNKRRVEVASALNLLGMQCYYKKQYAYARACFIYSSLLGNPHGYKNYLSVR